MIQFPLCNSQIEQTWSFVLSPPEGLFSPSGWANLHLQRCWVYKNPKMSHQHTYPLECRRFWGNLDIHLRLLFPSPLSHPPLQSYWIVLKNFGLKLQKLLSILLHSTLCFFLLTAILLSQGSDLESRWVVWLLLLVQTSKSWYHSSRGARPTASTRHLKINNWS